MSAYSTSKRQCGDEQGRQGERIVGGGGGGSAGLREGGFRFLEGFPEDAELGGVVQGVVGDGDAGELDDAALDGVHEGEIAHHPWEKRALAVAVVGFVVEDDDVFYAHEIAKDALHHLAFGLAGEEIVAAAAFEESLATGGDGDFFAELEGVVIGDDDLRLADFREHVRREDLAGFVVTLDFVGQKDVEAILDGDAGGDDEEAFGKEFRGRVAGGVDRLPCDDHGHDGGLARAGGELERDAEEGGVRLGIRGFEILLELFILRLFRRDFGEPDGGLHGLDLAEERAQAVEFVVPPMLEQAGGFRGDAPVLGIGDFPPGVHGGADFVDDGAGIVGLAIDGDAAGRFHGECRLAVGFGLFRLRDRSYVGAFPALRKNGVGGLAGGVEFPMPCRIAIG